MAECAAGDTACWQSEWEWKNRWYNAHGYENAGGNNYVYTGNYVFKDPGALLELVRDFAAGRSPIPPALGGAKFTLQLGRFSYSLEPRGRDNAASTMYGGLATAADMLDLGLTGLCAFAYVLEQSAAAATGPGAAAGLFGGQVAYTLFQPALFIIDSVAFYSIFRADVAAGRTSYDPRNHEIALGVDTVISAFTFGMSSVNQTVVPGMFVSGAFDTLQVSYDFMRATGAWSGYSYVFRW